MAVIRSVLPDNSLKSQGDVADDLIGGDQSFQGVFRIDDVIWGGGGNDTLNGGLGKNTLRGQFGDDQFSVGQGSLKDNALGGGGDDTFTINIAPAEAGARHFINGGAGYDSLFIGTIVGASAVKFSGELVRVDNKVIARAVDVEAIFGGSGNDVLNARGIESSFGFLQGYRLYGGDGNDTLTGHKTTLNVLIGAKGEDVLVGGGKGDYLYDGKLGDAGRPTADFYDETDVLRGGAGADRLFSLAGNDRLIGGAGKDTIRSVSGDDEIRGGKNNDSVYFSAQVNTFGVSVEVKSRAQARLEGLDIDGGLGRDEVNFYDVVVSPSAGDTNFLEGVRVRLDKGFGIELGTGLGGRFKIESVEDLSGTPRQDALFGNAAKNTFEGFGGNDLLVGGRNNDMLYGGSGRDTLRGGAGQDELTGGTAKDRLEGGPGFDTFIFRKKFGQDTVVDFNPLSNKEKIDLDRSFFSNFKHLKKNMDQIGEDVIIRVDESQAIKLLGVAKADLGPGDFIL